MKLLLDTSTFLLLNLNPSRVSSAAYRACASLDNDRYLSVVSVWEIALKYSAGKLALPEPPALYVPARREVNQISSLRLDERSCFHLAQLGSDERHRDPFGRMLVCQAVTHGLTIVSPDRAFGLYPVAVLW